MAFKEYDRKPTFLEMEIQRGFENSRNRQILSETDGSIHWEPLEKIVAEHYPVGQSESGNKAYPPFVNDRHNGATDIRRNGASEKG